MEYKGYLAAVEFDDSADMLHGRIVNSGPYPIATFEATEAGQLRHEFERSVDEYLTWCVEDGVEPKRPFSSKLNVRLGTELHSFVAAVAMANGMSINAWIVHALRETVAAESGGGRPASRSTESAPAAPAAGRTRPPRPKSPR